MNSRPASPIKSRSHTPLPTKVLKLDVDSSKYQASRAIGPGFHIYHDPPSAVVPRNGSTAQELVHDDKENILQPKIMGLVQQNYTHRRPLGPLSIRKYPGYVTAAELLRRGRQRLTTVYQPKNATNGSGSMHKFNGLPSFVTPPRNSLDKILHRSGTLQDVDVDEIEQMLLRKLREVTQRKRAMSVGANRGKIHLVRKPQVNISSN